MNHDSDLKPDADEAMSFAAVGPARAGSRTGSRTSQLTAATAVFAILAAAACASSMPGFATERLSERSGVRRATVGVGSGDAAIAVMAAMAFDLLARDRQLTPPVRPTSSPSIADTVETASITWRHAPDDVRPPALRVDLRLLNLPPPVRV